MREFLAPEQEATQQRRDSVHQQGTSGLFTVDPSASTPSQPSPPLPPAPQQQPQYPEQQLTSQLGVHQHPSQQPCEPGGGEGSGGTGEEEAEAYGSSARTHLRPFDPQHPHPHPHSQIQQQQQHENLDGAAESADNPLQTQHPHLLQPHPPHPLLAHHPQQPSTSASPPPQLPQQLSPQYGSPAQLPVPLQPPLQLQGVPSGSPLSLSLFGPTASAGSVGPQDMQYEPLGLSSLHSQTHPHPHSHPQPTHQPPLSASLQQSPLLSPSPQPILQNSPLSQSQLQQQSSPSQQTQSASTVPSPQQSGQVIQQSPQQMQLPQQQPLTQQLQPPQLSSSPSQQLQPQLQQHVVWDELRQRDAQILVLQKKLGHFRSWLAGVHAKVQATNPSAINNYKRLYVGNLPPNTTEEELKQFLHNLMLRTGANAAPGNAILSCKLKAAPAAGAPPGAAGPVPPPGPGPPDKHYAFIELRSVEEASNAMAFDGVAFKNAYLKVRRPSNYDVATAVMLGPIASDPTIDLSQLEICRTVVENSPHKLFVGGLPCEWGEDMVKELLVPYGNLKSFNLVMDKSTGKSKGYAFCEYVEDSSADLLIKNLHMRRIGSKALTVKRAMEGSRTGGVGLGVGSPSGGAAAVSAGAGPPGSGGSGSAAAAAMVAAAAQQQQQQQLLSPQAIPPLTPANMAVMSRVAAASPGGPGGGGGPGGAAAAAAAAAAMAAAALGGVGSDNSSASSLRNSWGADVTEAINVLLQSQSRNLFAAAAAVAANPAASQTQGTVPGLAAALQQFHSRGGADLSTVGSGGSSNSELAQGVRSMGQAHHGHHPGHHPHHPQHPSQQQQQQEAAAAAAAEAAAQQLAAAAGVGAFDLSSLGPGIGFW